MPNARNWQVFNVKLKLNILASSSISDLMEWIRVKFSVWWPLTLSYDCSGRALQAYTHINTTMSKIGKETANQNWKLKIDINRSL